MAQRDYQGMDPGDLGDPGDQMQEEAQAMLHALPRSGFWRRVGGGLATGARKGWHAYSEHRQGMAAARAVTTAVKAGALKEEGSSKPQVGTGKTVEGSAAPALDLKDLEAESVDLGDRAKDGFASGIGILAPFVLAAILGLSNGYFFAGFHDFHWGDTSIMLAYAGGYVLEAVGLAAIFKASRSLKTGSRAFFWYAFLFAMSMSVISLLAQYLYLQLQEMSGALVIPDSAIAHIPLFNMLVGVGGMQGHDWLFLLRGGAFHLAELGCTFLISKKGKSLQRLIAQQREVQDAELAFRRNRLVSDLERTIADQFDLMMSQQRRVTELQFNKYMDSMRGEPASPALGQRVWTDEDALLGGDESWLLEANRRIERERAARLQAGEEEADWGEGGGGSKKK